MKKTLTIMILLFALLLSGCTKLSDTQKELEICIKNLIEENESNTCDTATRNHLIETMVIESAASLDFFDQSVLVDYSNFRDEYFIYILKFEDISDTTLDIEDMFDISKQIYIDFDEILEISQISTVYFNPITHSYSYIFTATDVYFNFTNQDTMENLLLQKDNFIKDVLDTTVVEFGILTLESLNYSVVIDLDFKNKTFSELNITTLTTNPPKTSLETIALVKDYLINEGFTED
ncbi:hypothetical protein [Mariniplasma anaerobium]|uniref:Lipoprotein n=1 Tax=Mariniplasma anaerobium TaxID=2735436 RepID=A0A7U9TIA0_9MOLU|nr:hypothetical protein [Mariniplasma anaerobium]BCR35739.1 hypothetical protein MPAN_006320 [Mariniplasma anaerobium]